MNIIEEFIDLNPFSRPGTKLKKVTGIVVHNTAMPGKDARHILKYFKELSVQELKDDIVDRFASTHFVVDDEEVLQCLPFDEIGYHVGAYKYKEGIQEKIGMYPNAHMIGIETCHKDWGGQFSVKTTRNLIDLILFLLDLYNLDIKDIYCHYDITGKKCPYYFYKNNKKWIDFINIIKLKKEQYDEKARHFFC